MLAGASGRFKALDERAIMCDEPDDLVNVLYELRTNEDLLALAIRRLKNGAAAEDAVQQFLGLRFRYVFCAWRRRREATPAVPFSWYLLKSYRRFCRQLAELRTEFRVALSSSLTGGDPTLHQIAAIDRRRMQSVLTAALQRLKPQYREVLILSTREGLTDDQIGRKLNIDPRNAKVRRFRARQELERSISVVMCELTDGQVADWKGLCRALVDGSRLVEPTPAGRVWQLLDASGREAAMQEASRLAIPRRTRHAALLAQFNAALVRKDFFVPGYFEALLAGRNVDPALMMIAAADRHGKTFFLIRRNRGLFDAAFEGLVRRCPWPFQVVY